MKFFTPTRIAEIDDADEYLALRDEYWRYLDSIRHQLPSRLIELANLDGIHDGLLSRMNFDPAGQELSLTLRCGYFNTGYFNLRLTYRNAVVSPDHMDLLTYVARSTVSQMYHSCDLANHELDVLSEGIFVHRLMFHNTGSTDPDSVSPIWFAIQFRSLCWRVEPRISRRLPTFVERYPGGQP